MNHGSKSSGSFALLMTAAPRSALVTIEALNADTADAQTRHTHPTRSPAPASIPSSPSAFFGGPSDPGVRGGTVGAGTIISPVIQGQNYEQLFEAGADAFADLN